MDRIEVNVLTKEIRQVPLTEQEIETAQINTALEKEKDKETKDIILQKEKGLSDEIDSAKTIEDLKAVIRKIISN